MTKAIFLCFFLMGVVQSVLFPGLKTKAFLDVYVGDFYYPNRSLYVKTETFINHHLEPHGKVLYIEQGTHNETMLMLFVRIKETPEGLLLTPYRIAGKNVADQSPRTFNTSEAKDLKLSDFIMYTTDSPYVLNYLGKYTTGTWVNKDTPSNQPDTYHVKVTCPTFAFWFFPGQINNNTPDYDNLTYQLPRNSSPNKCNSISA